MALNSFQIPFRDKMNDDRGFLVRSWEDFFKYLKDIVDPLGLEKSFTILNNQSVAVKFDGLVLNKNITRQAFIDYFIQRISNSVELIETGILRAVYLPTSNTWIIANMGGSGPATSGITFSINSSGEILYTSTNAAGTFTVSKLTVRVRTMFGKNLQS
jgi:hypothetical protein